MRMMLIVGIGFVSVLAFHSNAGSQTIQTDTTKEAPETSVTIITDIDSSVIFIDSTRVGLTPLSINTLSPGPHGLVAQHPDMEDWLTSNTVDSFVVAPGQHLTLRYTFERRYRITSVPFDAEVVLADSVVGKTPLVFVPPAPDVGKVTIRKQGFEPSEFDLSSSQRGVLSVTLKKLWDGDPHDDIFRTGNGQVSRPLPLTLAVAGTVLSGTAAAYFKIQADDRYRDYRNTGNQAALAKSRRLDTAAAIALVATQIGLGVFTYLVLSE